jgi:NAD(P)-dependent dehydrogenase (short-subunit alcohol dehydrogenase family)
MSELLRGKVAVVTGAANGIGLACARRLAAIDADIALLRYR